MIIFTLILSCFIVNSLKCYDYKPLSEIKVVECAGSCVYTGLEVIIVKYCLSEKQSDYCINDKDGDVKYCRTDLCNETPTC